jgi:hypothetical protein
MTIAATKQILKQYLDDKRNKVITLSGLWGTGKSYLWDEVKVISDDSAVKNSLYVSLFGVSDLATLKLKIVQSALPAAGKSNTATDFVKKSWVEGIKALRSIHPKAAALAELALLAAPVMLRNRFIVLDDIERKHEKLSIDEVMGFIDEFTKRYNARFLLILNVDQLGDRSIWDKFLEKVVDQEVTLSTSPEEAFDIAIKLTPSPYANYIKLASIVCDITNIRVIRKIIDLIGRILDGHKVLKTEVLQRVIPSAVLLAAIRYKGIMDGPDARFVVKFNSMTQALARHTNNSKVMTPEEQERAKQNAQWTLLMDKLGIASADEYEALVDDYLSSGSYAVLGLAKLLERYAGEANGLVVRNRIEAFFDRSIWHPEISDEELLTDAKALLSDVASFDAATVTLLHARLVAIEGGSLLAEQFIGVWIAAFKARDVKGPEADVYRVTIFHPDIEAAFKETNESFCSRLSLLEVTSTVVTKRAWGLEETVVMKASTVDDYEKAIRSVTGRDLKIFLLGCMDLYSNSGNYEEQFGSAMKKFLGACRRICSDPESIKLARLIQNLFENAKLTSDLDSPEIKASVI